MYAALKKLPLQRKFTKDALMFSLQPRASITYGRSFPWQYSKSWGYTLEAHPLSKTQSQSRKAIHMSCIQLARTFSQKGVLR